MKFTIKALLFSDFKSAQIVTVAEFAVCVVGTSTMQDYYPILIARSYACPTMPCIVKCTIDHKQDIVILQTTV